MAPIETLITKTAVIGDGWERENSASATTILIARFPSLVA